MTAKNMKHLVMNSCFMIIIFIQFYTCSAMIHCALIYANFSYLHLFHYSVFLYCFTPFQFFHTSIS